MSKEVLGNVAEKFIQLSKLPFSSIYLNCPSPPFAVEWEGHPEVAEMIQLQRAGMPGEENHEQPLDAVDDSLETGPDPNMEEARSTNKFATLVNMED